MIRNYLGFARGVTGADLAQRAYQQAWIFGTRFVLMREVTSLRCHGDRHVLAISDGKEVGARSVILAMGVTYRRLDIPSLERLVGAGVYYGASPSEAPFFSGGRVYVVGGGNSAGQAALHLARHASQVTILVRGSTLAASMSRYLINEIDAAQNIEVRFHTHVVDGIGEQRLQRLTLHDDSTDVTCEVDADALFVLIGAHPNTDWLPPEIARDEYGFVVTGFDLTHDNLLIDRWTLARAPYPFETSFPGVFAVGDVRSRSVKRVASAVGEGSAAIQHVHKHLETWSKWSAIQRTV
jgi:thioredoxin reductase (NADPH)